jgi:hypothetical protein
LTLRAQSLINMATCHCQSPHERKHAASLKGTARLLGAGLGASSDRERLNRHEF